MLIAKILISSLIMVFCSSSAANQLTNKNIEKLQESIKYYPKMVGPEVISGAGFEGHASFNPTETHVVFALYNNDHSHSVIAQSFWKSGSWSDPEIVDFSGKYSDGSPAFSPDGKTLYFSSNRPIIGQEVRNNLDLWMSQRNNNTWGEPKHLGNQVNSEFNEFSPTLDNNGNFYFSSKRPDGYGDMDIYLAKISDKGFGVPKLLSTNINSTYQEGNVGVSPDGKLLFVMVQNKPGGLGFDDIYYSKNEGGKWLPLKNIGDVVNTYTYDFSPKVTSDGENLVFSSRVNINYSLLNKKMNMESYKSLLNSPFNGFGNIYRIKIEELKIN